MTMTDHPMHAHPDQSSSVDALADVVRFRAGTQKHRMLRAYANAPLFLEGLNDWEAATDANLTHSTYWMRAHDLRVDGLIEPVEFGPGIPMTREGGAGLQRVVCRITEAGRDYLGKLEAGS
jgi:hypothetical protein